MYSLVLWEAQHDVLFPSSPALSVTGLLLRGGPQTPAAGRTCVPHCVATLRPLLTMRRSLLLWAAHDLALLESSGTWQVSSVLLPLGLRSLNCPDASFPAEKEFRGEVTPGDLAT